MNSFEYKVMDEGFMHTNDFLKVQEILNSLGQDGWRFMVSLGGKAIFMRTLQVD